MTNTETAIAQLLVAMADDELILGHRDSEWTGHSPILEEDIAFSNIAQDEIGHALVWYTLHEQLTGTNPDAMAFERSWEDFRCSRFVTYPKGDFAYTVVRQFLFDAAEQVRLRALSQSSYAPIRDAAAKILKEEAYHRMHSQGLFDRLGRGTAESHRRMQDALNAALPQAVELFEPLPMEDCLVADGVMPANVALSKEWYNEIAPVIHAATLVSPLQSSNGLRPSAGGRSGNHTEFLKSVVDDMQSVYRLVPGGKW